MDKENTKRLEEALLNYIERELNEPSTEHTEIVKTIPEMARVLIDMWNSQLV